MTNRVGHAGRTTRSRPVLGSLIVLYFVIALEVLVMISPFAAFFYAAVGPFLLALAGHRATRWLAAFFLPHMVVPPDLFLKTVRVAGSVLLVLGFAIFLVCAGQVYGNKLLRKGTAVRGLYSVVRHPQYLGLALSGLGLAILWPRFLVLALWSVMLIFYYVLARDEERRMRSRYAEEYRAYMDRTGMLLPKAFEDRLKGLGGPGPQWAKATLVFVGLVGAVLGGGFALRTYTIAALPLWSDGHVTSLPILPGDAPMLEHRMAALLDLPEVRSRLERTPGSFLAYFLPKDYVMQGMIADTGGEWRLYKQHHAAAMILDWIFHPFRHLEEGHRVHRHGASMEMNPRAPSGDIERRLIFVRVDTGKTVNDRRDLFAIGAMRTPVFFADIDVHSLRLEGVRDLPPGTGWGQVPTPTF